MSAQIPLRDRISISDATHSGLASDRPMFRTGVPGATSGPHLRPDPSLSPGGSTEAENYSRNFLIIAEAPPPVQVAESARHPQTLHPVMALKFLTSRSAVLQARACTVSVGFRAPLVPISEAPRMPRFGASCEKPHRSTTFVSGLAPMRVPP